MKWTLNIIILLLYNCSLIIKISKSDTCFWRHFWSLFSFFGLLQSTFLWSFIFNINVVDCWLVYLRWSGQTSFVLILFLGCAIKIALGCIQNGHTDYPTGLRNFVARFLVGCSYLLISLIFFYWYKTSFKFIAHDLLFLLLTCVFKLTG